MLPKANSDQEQQTWRCHRLYDIHTDSLLSDTRDCNKAHTYTGKEGFPRKWLRHWALRMTSDIQERRAQKEGRGAAQKEDTIGNAQRSISGMTPIQNIHTLGFLKSEGLVSIPNMGVGWGQGGEVA